MRGSGDPNSQATVVSGRTRNNKNVVLQTRSVYPHLQKALNDYKKMFLEMSGVPLDNIKTPEDMRKAYETAMLEWEKLSDIAASKPGDLGRGGRLLIAARDLWQAQTLLNSSSEDDQYLGSAIANNAMRHMGRIMSTVNPSHPFTNKWKQMISSYANDQGKEQIDYLVNKNLISEDKGNKLKNNVEKLFLDAYASKTALPTWVAVQTMERSAKALEKLENSSDLGKDANKVIENAKESMKELISYSQENLEDPKHSKRQWHVMRFSPTTITRAEAIAAALEHPESKIINQQIGRENLIEKHRQVASQYAQTLNDTPVLSLSNKEWLNQIANYQQYICTDNNGVIANHSPNFAILLSPEIGESVTNSELDEVLLHEVIHTTQPKSSKPLGYRDDLHRFWEEQILLEGSTQALTLEAMRQNNKQWEDSQTRVHGYSMIAAVVEEAAEYSALKTGRSKHEILAEMSTTLGNKRLEKLAEQTIGDKSPAAQTKLLEALDPIVYDWEEQADRAGQNPSFRNQIRKALQSL